jgi:alpha-tubulin suppressor-like RCC1 family protein
MRHLASNARAMARALALSLGVLIGGFAVSAGPAAAGDGPASPPIAVGAQHVCVLPGDGTVICWGDNTVGQLGNGAFADPNAPAGDILRLNTVVTSEPGVGETCDQLAEQVELCHGGSNALSGVVAITAGASHTCALLHDTTVRCWGANAPFDGGIGGLFYSGGQLGDGTTHARANPVTVVAGPGVTSPLHDVRAISAGGASTCALLEDGTAMCWGNAPQRTSPVPIPVLAASGQPLTGIAQLSVGDTHACARLLDSTAVCWGTRPDILGGDDVNGVADNGYPVAVMDAGQSAGALGGIDAVSVGHGVVNGPNGFALGHACALLAGSVSCWGVNDVSQLGNGVPTSETAGYAVHVQAGPGSDLELSDVSAIAAGTYFTCALIGDGGVKCWGLGFGTPPGNPQGFEGAGVPIVVAAPSEHAVALAAGRGFCYLKDNGAVVCPQDPYGGLLLGSIPLVVVPGSAPTPSPSLSPHPSPGGSPVASLAANASPQPAGPLAQGFYPVDRILGPATDGQITLTQIEVDGVGHVRLSLLYRNTGTVPWALGCRAGPQGVSLTLQGGRVVPASDTFCSHNVGETWSLPIGGTLESWAIFPVVDSDGAPFSLTWYSWSLRDISLRAPDRPSLRESVPTPAEINLDPVILTETVVIGAGIVLLLPFPGSLFNSTLEANYPEVSGWVRRLRRFPARLVGRAPTPPSADAPPSPVATNADFWARPTGIAAFVLLSTLVSCFLDPTFGLSVTSLATFLGIGGGIVLTTLAWDVPAAMRYRRIGASWTVRALPGTLVIGIACVLITRLTDVHPGYLYGLIIAMGATTNLSVEEQGRSSVWGAAGTLVVALVAWLALWLVNSIGPARGDPGFLFVVVQTVLAAAVSGGVFLAAFGMIPLRFLTGHAILTWKWRPWAVFALIGLFAFLTIIVNPQNGYLSDTTRTPLFTIVALLVFFGVGSVAFWGSFWLRGRRAERAAKS